MTWLHRLRTRIVRPFVMSTVIGQEKPADVPANPAVDAVVAPGAPRPPVRLVLPAAAGRQPVDLRTYYQTRRDIKTIICHHSAGNPSATVASVRKFHTDPAPRGRGWSDIGYHVVLRWDQWGWAVEPGRPVELVGSHDKDQNRNSIGVCLFGDYTSKPVPPEAWGLLVEVITGLVVLYNLQVSDVEGHRENEPPGSATDCPGYDPADLRTAVAAHLSTRAL